jgi:hypothetical protein
MREKRREKIAKAKELTQQINTIRQEYKMKLEEFNQLKERRKI